MTTLLISDVHLHAGAPGATRGFLSYLENCRAEALYILGDLFEAWIGDDHRGELETRVIDALARLGERGTQVYFMHGNRDFLIGEDFARASGVTLLSDPCLVELAGEPVLLMHGDSLCTRDEAYMRFRAMTRDPQWQAQILAMPLEQRLALARDLRSQSGEASSNKAEDIMDVTPDEVVKAMKAHGVRTFIHGHTHRPAVHDLDIDDKCARRIVLGDWGEDHGWQVRASADEAPTLERFTF